MRKIFIWIISIFFLTGCSNIISRNNVDRNEEIYRNLYENWQLEELKSQLELNSKSGENPVILKYRKLVVEREKDKEKLEALIEEVKNELAEGNSKTLRDSLNFSLRNMLAEKEIEKIDFSRIGVLTGRLNFFKNSASNIVAFTMEDRTIYFDVKFSLEKGDWKITEFKERR